MLGIPHPATRTLRLAAAVVLQACAQPTTHAALDAPPPLRSFCTIVLAADSEEILIAHAFGRDTTSQRIADVLEAGGRVLALRGDTVVLQPYYLTTRVAPDSGPPVTIFRGASTSMPDLAFIPVTPNVSIREFRTPGPPRRPPIFPLVLHSLFLLSIFATDAALLLSL